MAPTPADYLASVGGTAPYRHLVGVTGRARLRRSVRLGLVVALGRGRYGVAGMAPELLTATAEGGCLSHLSAAVHHGWGIIRRPQVVHVTVPRGSRRSRGADLRRHYALLEDSELAAGVTAPVRTVLDCARTLPLPQALAVVDSALREGSVTRWGLDEAARGCHAQGVRRARRVIAQGDARAANAFESTLRGVLLLHGLTTFTPQVVIAEPGVFAVADLADVEARVALEADGYGVHGTRKAFAADLARHDELQSAGWVTRRFAFEHVVHRPDWVVAQVRSALTQRLVSGPPRRQRRVAAGRQAA